MIKRLVKVNDDLYRGGAPSVQDVIDLNKFLGIKKLVSLDADAANRIGRITKLLGIEHVIIPIDVAKPRSVLPLFAVNINDLLMKGGPTFVHCLQGKDRTGLIIAMFRCQNENWSYEKALNEAKKFGFGFGLPPETIKIFMKMIELSCQNQSNKSHIEDENKADIVENSRPGSKWDAPVIDQADMSSFVPYLDIERQYPYNSEYDKVPSINGVGPTANIGTGFVEV